MRHYVLVIALAAVASCSACASLPHPARDAGACARLTASSVNDRLAHPCAYADDLARCTGLAESERERVAQRCAEEMDRVRK